MLAHLAYSRHPFSLRGIVAFGLALGGLAAFVAVADRADAADTLPLGNLDARSTAKVSSGDTAPAGSLVTGLSFEAAEAAVPAGALDDTGVTSDRALLRDANRASVFLGTSITDRLELTLGLHGSFEHVTSGDRDGLFPEDTVETAARDEEDGGWRGNVKQTGFAGASLFVKLKLADLSGLRLAFAPFIESGAGEQATYSLTRSVGPKAGFMTIASYGAPGVADVSLNAGYRYRDPEAVGGVALRHEQFLKASVRAHVARTVSLFVAGDGRRLMVADAGKLDIESGKRTYEPEESGEVKGGFAVALGDVDLTVFGGSRPKNAGGFGFGKSSYGTALSMPLGNYRGDRPRSSFATEIAKQQDEKDAAAKEAPKAELVGPPAASDVKPATDEYIDMIGRDIDPLDALGTEEAADFKDVDARVKQYEADAKVESEDARIERELKELKAADELAAAERERLAAAEAERARARAVENSKEDDELMREWMSEAQREADSIESIGQEDMEWNGLD